MHSTLKGFALLGLAAFAVVASTSWAAGCSSPTFCEGGFTRTVKGVATCEGLCSPTKCTNAGNVCVDNLCALQCAAQGDCPLGQDCVAVPMDAADGGPGAMTSVCQNNGKSAIGLKCPQGGECAGQLSCPDGSNCDFNQCGGDACTPDPIACGSAAKCSIGKCSDGSACTVQGCTQDQCKPLSCLSNGVGDADAYCTMLDCHADTDCPGGNWCAVIRDPHKICNAPAQKLPGLCGKTTDTTCVMAGGADGTTFTQGPWCTQRNECRIRKACDPCKADLDCAAIPGQHCTTMPMGGDKFCTSDCTSDADCGDGFQCTGNACVPRYGTCKGTGKFCEPCHNDGECSAGTYCTRETSGVERFCVAPIGSVPCTSDAQCPTSPSGVHGKCMDETANSSPGDGVYHTCWLAFIPASYRFVCWPENTGAACFKGADCFSKVCVGANPAAQEAGACK